ncbi:MAG TPA: SDR family NAD(P)-dependent oxidoreductase [Streptosporangiaceae bacterium]|nr:SDR family NAD(P)-dependent oxidoreductase [Streptosporangiaceae bacterium]
MDQGRHLGLRALVTGAGSGIGLATALRLAREGAEVVGCDVDADALSRAQEMLTASGLSGRMHRCDITDQSQVDALLAVAAGDRGFGILANVAGILDDFTPAGEVRDAIWDRVLSVNLTGSMRVSRAVLPLMLRSGGGVIVNVASSAGFTGGAGGAAYTASKHGVIGLSRSIAFLYADRGIRCNVVCPGGVDTPMAHSARPRSELTLARMKLSLARAPAPAAPEEIAALISWLACAEAAHVNGAVVAADGGWSAG